MAYTSGIRRPQTRELCELCREDSFKWKCVDCDMSLCEKCKTIHPRVPLTAQHEIVTKGAQTKDAKKKVIIDNIPCRDHPKKMTTSFCRSCDALICPECVASSHKNHNFNSIESALDDKFGLLRSMHDKIGANLKCCESKTSEVKDFKPKYNAIFEESLTNIRLKEQEIIETVRKHSKELQEKVRSERTRIIGIISKIEQDVNNMKRNLEDQRSKTDTTLNSNQGSNIFKAVSKIKELTFDSLPNQVEKFIPETESLKKIHESFGSFHKLSIPTTDILPKIELKVNKTFTTDLPQVNLVVSLTPTSAWISCYNNKLIRKVNIQDNKMTTTQEVSTKVFDMALTLNDELLLSMAKGPEVKMLKKSGELVPFLTLDHLLPRGIHVANSDNVILGVKEPDEAFKPSDQSQRAVVVYGMDGKQKQRYQYDKEGKRLFTNPFRITTNNNRDILIIDRTSGNTGRVVCLDKQGNSKWLYEGHYKINASKQLYPRDIVTTSVGQIIISDYGSHSLHVLSENGEVLTCKVTKEMGIMWPDGFDICNEGRLWLGCDTAKNKTDAKLHIIELISKD